MSSFVTRLHSLPFVETMGFGERARTPSLDFEKPYLVVDFLSMEKIGRRNRMPSPPFCSWGKAEDVVRLQHQLATFGFLSFHWISGHL